MNCFKCRQSLTRKTVASSGRRKNGSQWFLCRECREAYKAEREMDREAYQAAQGDYVKVGEKGKETMGWNGIPSEKSLRARSR